MHCTALYLFHCSALHHIWLHLQALHCWGRILHRSWCCQNTQTKGNRNEAEKEGGGGGGWHKHLLLLYSKCCAILLYIHMGILYYLSIQVYLFTQINKMIPIKVFKLTLMLPTLVWGLILLVMVTPLVQTWDMGKNAVSILAPSFLLQ